MPRGRKNGVLTFQLCMGRLGSVKVCTHACFALVWLILAFCNIEAIPAGRELTGYGLITIRGEKKYSQLPHGIEVIEKLFRLVRGKWLECRL